MRMKMKMKIKIKMKIKMASFMIQRRGWRTVITVSQE